jgi:hypothetical protein
MSRHQNRSHSTMGTELGECLRQLRTESGSVLETHVIRPDDAPALFATAAMGSLLASALAHALVNLIKGTSQSPTRAPALCATCPRSIRHKPFSAVTVVPHADGPSQGLALGICPRCATTRDEVFQKGNQALKTLWPGTREISLHHEGGRA